MTPQITTFNLGSGPVTLGDAYKLPANHPKATSVVETPTYSFCIIFKDRVVMIDAGALPTGIHAEEYPMTEPTPPPLLQQMAQQNISADRVSEVIITPHPLGPLQRPLPRDKWQVDTGLSQRASPHPHGRLEPRTV